MSWSCWSHFVRTHAPSSAAAVGAAVKAVEIADCDVATAGGQADSAMGRGKGAESGRVQAGNTAPWARSSLLRGTHPTAGAAQETQPAVGPHTVQFFDEQAVATESARVDLPVIAYCSGECQRGHWKLHKTVCKETTKRLQTVTELMRGPGDDDHQRRYAGRRCGGQNCTAQCVSE